MNASAVKEPFVAIACGGTGGHLFPGIAIGEELKKHGCKVALLISSKEIDQLAVRTAQGVDVFTLPAVGLQNGNYLTFVASFLRSLFAARKVFRKCKPAAVLAMGGFTSAPPVFVGRNCGAKTFLHESNTIPGKANRYLARFVNEVFTGFPEAAERLAAKRISCTGTPVRTQFQQQETAKCRSALGLDANHPTVLVVGGSQGASGLNDVILSALPLLEKNDWQWLHLTGERDFERVKAAYAGLNIEAVVKPFLAEMDLALGAATACVSRAGASSLAEIAAMRLPSLLVPFPAAADNHQFFNAVAFERTGAAKMVEQKNAAPRETAALLKELVENKEARSKMQHALSRWHVPDAAAEIAMRILKSISETAICHCDCTHGHSHA